MLSNVREQWFSNVRADILSGLVVGLALIPEAIAFSIIAGVDPKVGLYASFCIAVIIFFRRRSSSYDFGSYGCHGFGYDNARKGTRASILIRCDSINWRHTDFGRIF